MKQTVILVNIKRCVGCHTCEIVCSEYHGSQHVNVARWGPEILGGELKTFYIPLFSEAQPECNECMESEQGPPCVDACPTQALQLLEEKNNIEKRAGIHSIHRT